VVTKNLKDFPSAACESLGVRVLGPDDFLVDLHRIDPPATHRALSDQAAALTRPALTLYEVLDYVAKDAPQFAGLVRESP